jgi:uncharacterized protein YjbI with pentapeptide repeats
MEIYNVEKRIFVGNSHKFSPGDRIYRFNQCRFVDARQMSFGAAASFAFCEFEGDFEHCDFGEASFRDCRFTGQYTDCTWVDATISRSVLANVRMKNSPMWGLNFTACHLSQCAFEDCEASWMHAELCALLKVKWQGCDLKGCGISRTRMIEVRVDDCNIENFDVAYSDGIDVFMGQETTTFGDTNIWRYTR